MKNAGTEEVLSAPHSPSQNPYSERLNGSMRRECLDRAIVFSERHLRRSLRRHFRYYNRYRVHQALEMDAPEGRMAQAQTIREGEVTAIRQIGELQHHYERTAA